MPNVSGSGRRRRQRVGYAGAVLAVALLAVFVAVHAVWYARLLVFLPAAFGAVGWLQARRGTCIAQARHGTIEQEDFSTRPAPAAELVASRRVAAGIGREALAIGAAAAAIAAATALFS